MQYLEKEGISLQDIPRPTPEPDEVLIGLSLAGLCNTDIEIARGYLDFQGTLGHEFVGIVVEDPQGELEGEKVVGEINIPCGHCSACNNCQPNHCLNIKAVGMRDYPGVFSEFFTLPRENVHVVPERIADIQAVFVEPLAASLEIPEKNHLKQTDKIAVLGDGRLGLMTAAALYFLNFEIHLVGKHQVKLNTLDHLHIDTYLLGDDIPKMDKVIDCTGSKSGVDTALQLIKPEGTIILKTTIAGDTSLNLSQVTVEELKIVGSRCGPFPAALRLLGNNDPGVAKFVSRIYPLAEAERAFAAAKEKDNIKILLKGEYHEKG
ncbi:MAG: alcohol dehydrogenase catalytic domain-containing protein [Bacillota bacterium]